MNQVLCDKTNDLNLQLQEKGWDLNRKLTAQGMYCVIEQINKPKMQGKKWDLNRNWQVKALSEYKMAFVSKEQSAIVSKLFNK